MERLQRPLGRGNSLAKHLCEDFLCVVCLPRLGLGAGPEQLVVLGRGGRDAALLHETEPPRGRAHVAEPRVAVDEGAKALLGGLQARGHPREGRLRPLHVARLRVRLDERGVRHDVGRQPGGECSLKPGLGCSWIARASSRADKGGVGVEVRHCARRERALEPLLRGRKVAAGASARDDDREGGHAGLQAELPRAAEPVLHRREVAALAHRADDRVQGGQVGRDAFPPRPHKPPLRCLQVTLLRRCFQEHEVSVVAKLEAAVLPAVLEAGLREVQAAVLPGRQEDLRDGGPAQADVRVHALLEPALGQIQAARPRGAADDGAKHDGVRLDARPPRGLQPADDSRPVAHSDRHAHEAVEGLDVRRHASGAGLIEPA
mmetsp:Transcript_63260/g.184880  ORF Transcript_63260/g.184880 Transcript_63260/m.184880 type:complete len:375 (-) Transcript_63260:1414-2538(-)